MDKAQAPLAKDRRVGGELRGTGIIAPTGERQLRPLFAGPVTARASSVMCGRPRRSKGDLVCAPRSGAVMCPAYVARPLGPLALMQSAAWLPNRFTRWNGA